MTRAANKITKRTVDSLKAEDVVWDGDVCGFGVRCQRRDKTYVLKCRYQGRQLWLTIGKHGSPWTPEKARKEAVRLLGLVADNKDPAQARDEAKMDLMEIPPLPKPSVRWNHDPAMISSEFFNSLSHKRALGRMPRRGIQGGFTVNKIAAGCQ